MNINNMNKKFFKNYQILESGASLLCGYSCEESKASTDRDKISRTKVDYIVSYPFGTRPIKKNKKFKRKL